MADIQTLAIGQIVFSKCGRDKGLPFVITGVDGEYALLTDGILRKLDKPKKKKIKHLQPVKYIDETLGGKITQGRHVENADFKLALEQFKNKKQ